MGKPLVLRVHEAVAVVCPLIGGVSISNPADKLSWRVDFLAAATSPQRVAAQAVVDDFDAVAPSAEDVRQSQYALDAQVVEWLDRLRTSTPAEIDTFIANNVISAPQAIMALKAVIKVLAHRLQV